MSLKRPLDILGAAATIFWLAAPAMAATVKTHHAELSQGVDLNRRIDVNQFELDPESHHSDGWSGAGIPMLTVIQSRSRLRSLS